MEATFPIFLPVSQFVSTNVQVTGIVKIRVLIEVWIRFFSYAWNHNSSKLLKLFKIYIASSNFIGKRAIGKIFAGRTTSSDIRTNVDASEWQDELNNKS